MNKIKEIFSKNTAPQFEEWGHDDYKKRSRYYSEKKDQSPTEWAIEEQEATLIDGVDTEPMSIGREHLEAIEEAGSLEDALRAYDSTYSLEAIDAGEQSPQLCVEMLLRINDKFEGEMTLEQRQAVALETIAVGHAIGRLAEMPPEESPDRTTLKGLTDLAEIMDLAQKYAPTEIAALEGEILQVAEKIDSRASDIVAEPVSGPIRKALKQFNRLSKDARMQIAFTDIVTRIANENLNVAEYNVEQRFNESEELFAYASMSDSSPKVARDAAELALEATGVYNPNTTTAT